MNRGLGFVFAAVVLVATMWLVYDRWTGAEISYEIAGATVTELRVTDAITLFGSSLTLTAGNYDSLQSASGTAYQVPAGRTLLVTGADVATTAGGVTEFILGYGTNALQDSGTAPLAGSEVYRVHLPAVAGLSGLRFSAFVPAGRYPWVRVDNSESWSVPVTGILIRDDFPAVLP